jgi:hypothetical protein
MKVRIFGKEMSALLIAGIILAVGATAALLTYYGQINGSATVEQSVLVDGQDYLGVNNYVWDGQTVQGKTFVELHRMKNRADADALVAFSTTCANSAGDDSTTTAMDFAWNSIGNDRCDGITTRYVEYFDDAGTDLGAYVPPSTCDVTVSSGSSIQTAIDGASSGDVVCVEADTYTEDVNVNKDITLAALVGPDDASHVIIAGLVDVSADNAKFTGFEIQPGSVGSQRAAITVTADNVEVTFNHVDSMTSTADGSIKGIYVAGGNAGDPVNNLSLENNLIEDISNSAKGTYGIMIQGAVNHVSIMHNTIQDLASPDGWGASGIEVTPTSAHTTVPTDVTIEYNHIESMGSGSEDGKGITIDWYDGGPTYADASEVQVHMNNFIDTPLDIRSLDMSHTLDATNNYFGTDGINVLGDPLGPIDATWMTKTDMTLEPGELDRFGIITDFDAALMPDTYDMTMQVIPQ